MSEPYKFTPADANLLWAIFGVIPRRELSKMVDWEVVGAKLGGLNQKAVAKRWSRLNIKMRENSDDDDMGEVGTDATQEIMSGGESKMVEGDDGAGTDGQIVTVKERTGGKATAKKRSHKTPIKSNAITGKGKAVKIKATWESVRAEVAAEAKAKERETEEGSDSEDQDA
ncbi:hypothetical protein EYC84_002977 [Monilinia fructicola]|uniref:Myb-like domain-containing protein n=1 Tax=Monilinia fructicola TaxID=38448 RepID=A0A5M9JS87_MONFR|nr:hypothetical protein EYC84_002977 [Monilinia fructicola]